MARLRPLAVAEANNGNPYFACRYGFSDLPGFMQCALCPSAATCDILGNKIFAENQNSYYENLRAQSIENKSTYYQNAEGFWCDADIDGDGWRKVKKDKHLKIIPRKFACDSGNAMHPDFWRCDTCSIAQECEICLCRQRLKEEKFARRHELPLAEKMRIESEYLREHRKEIRAEKLQRTKDKVKKFFEKVFSMWSEE